MNKHTISPATATSRTKRVALGAASVLTAGALLGVGVQGATAAPLDSEPTSTSSSSAGTGSTTESDTFLASIQKELRADMSNGHGVHVKAQKLASTVAGHTELFESLPENLQADLTTLKDASAAERADAVQTIETTALAGGYGDEITTIAEAVRDNPKHPLAAGIRAALGSDLGGSGDGTEAGADAATETATETDASVTKLALKLADNPGLFPKLPANLQSDLTDLKAAPATEQDAAAAAIATAAVDGEYGAGIQKIAERIQAHAGTEVEADADADADVEADTSADVEADTGK